MPESDTGARLLEAAKRVREHAYAPYSGFRVGAAIQSDSGRVYVGANVENASYGATVCAERAAVAAMIAAGEKRIVGVAVYAEGPELSMPCGMCRQVLVEFGKDATVVVGGPAGTRSTTLTALMPEPFIFEAPR
jgi:cytidine deaminase